MRRRLRAVGGAFQGQAMRAALLVVAMSACFALGSAWAANAAEGSDVAPGLSHRVVMQLEAEAVDDLANAPAIPTAIGREWRSFDRNGSPAGALTDIGWIVLAAFVAVVAEKAASHAASRRRRRALRTREGGATLADLLFLLVSDVVGLAVFVGAFLLIQRHLLSATGASLGLAVLAESVLVRWRVVTLIIGVILRPGEPLARLIDLGDGEARRLARFLSGVILAATVLIGFGRYGLLDEDSGAAHVIGLIIALTVCGLYVLIVVRARLAVEALIRGHHRPGVIGSIRQAIARAWLPTGLIGVAALLVIFVAGLSLGLLSYYRAVSSTLGILFVLLVLERLTEHGRNDDAPAGGEASRVEQLMARAFQRVFLAAFLLIAVMMVSWVWVDALGLPDETVSRVLHSVGAATGTLFAAYLIWSACRLAIDRHLRGGGPAMPGDDDDGEAPASRMQTILPLLRAAFGTVIAVLAVLIVLSRLGVDTAPLIAGAGVFGLAVSFGAQSLVRDVISGLFYMWDDAFRVGEYIDTGRLKGTVEALGIRSVRLRHQNGPLHTIPYGQLGAVTNLSRDFATLKFNLRFDPRTDVELVRKTTKQIGLAMQEDSPELAAEIMQPLKLQGLAEVVDNAVVLRFKFTSRPVKPSWVQREYLKRMYKVFAEKDIRFASGAVFLQTVPPVDAGPPPPSAETAGAAVATAATAGLGVAAALELAELAEPARSDA